MSLVGIIIRAGRAGGKRRSVQKRMNQQVAGQCPSGQFEAPMSALDSLPHRLRPLNDAIPEITLVEHCRAIKTGRITHNSALLYTKAQLLMRFRGAHSSFARGEGPTLSASIPIAFRLPSAVVGDRRSMWKHHSTHSLALTPNNQHNSSSKLWSP